MVPLLLPAYSGCMAETEKNGGGPGSGAVPEGERKSTSLPSPPAEARFPGWLLPILGAAAAGVFSGWWGAVFGGVVGFLIWRMR